jgi:septal ring factor EnvC (AmiA/AmiB activator)
MELPLSIVITLVTSAAVIAGAWGFQRATVARTVADQTAAKVENEKEVARLEASIKSLRADMEAAFRELRAEVKQRLDEYGRSRDKLGQRVGALSEQFAEQLGELRGALGRDISRSYRVPKLPLDNDDSGKAG